VKASVFESHGVNDTNVETKHFASWWAGLGAAGVPRKLWLSQEGHVDPFDYNRSAFVEALHQWFDYWLLALPNQVMSGAPVTVEHAPNSYGTDAAWPAAATSSAVTLGTNGLGGSGGTVSVTDNTSLTESAILTSPGTARSGRLTFTSAALTADARLSGTPSLTLRIKASRTDTPVDSACYLDVVKSFAASKASVISRGWLDASHSDSLSSPTPLVSGQWRTVTIPLRAQDDILAKGHQVGLAITLSDTEYTTPNSTGATVTIELAGSTLNLPVVGGIHLSPGTAPAVATQPPARTAKGVTASRVPLAS
jgi:X-Pro dipeptidyl-peptidase